MEKDELERKKQAIMAEIVAITSGDREEYTVPVVANITMSKMAYASYRQLLGMIELQEPNIPKEEYMENLYTNMFVAGLNLIVKDLVVKMLGGLMEGLSERGKHRDEEGA